MQKALAKRNGVAKLKLASAFSRYHL